MARDGEERGDEEDETESISSGWLSGLVTSPRESLQLSWPDTSRRAINLGHTRRRRARLFGPRARYVSSRLWQSALPAWRAASLVARPALPSSPDCNRLWGKGRKGLDGCAISEQFVNPLHSRHSFHSSRCGCTRVHPPGGNESALWRASISRISCSMLQLDWNLLGSSENLREPSLFNHFHWEWWIEEPL